MGKLKYTKGRFWEISSGRRALFLWEGSEGKVFGALWLKTRLQSGVHSINTWLDLAKRKGTGCGGGKCQVPAQSPPGGFTEPFPPHPPTRHQQQGLASSQHPSARFQQGGRRQRGSCQGRSKCPVRSAWGGCCSC